MVTFLSLFVALSAEIADEKNYWHFELECCVKLCMALENVVGLGDYGTSLKNYSLHLKILPLLRDRMTQS